MIETIRVRKCDICGREMKNEHVTITWPDSHKEDVCKDCTKRLNSKLKELRNETDDIYVIGIKDVPWIPGKEAPFTDFGKFTNLMEAEKCRMKCKANYDHVVIVKDPNDAIELAAEKKEEVKE